MKRSYDPERSTQLETNWKTTAATTTRRLIVACVSCISYRITAAIQRPYSEEGGGLLSRKLGPVREASAVSPVLMRGVNLHLHGLSFETSI